MEKWKEVKLNQITEKITKGTTPSNIGENFTDDGIMYFRSELIGKSKFIDKTSGLLFISESTHEKLKRSQIKQNDMLFSMAGIYLGKISLVGPDDFPANTNQAVAIIRFNSKDDLDFIYYYMTQKSFNIYVNSITAQAAQPNINLEQIGKLKINLPSLLIQKKIASILSAYDSLIENNNKRIKILEQMAENLYKEWFVRFRFPGHETTPIENGIPQGWHIEKLSSIFEVKYGKDHKNIEDGTIPIFGSGGIMRYGNKALYSDESVLIPRKGSLNNVMYYSGDFWTVDTMFYTKMKISHFAKYAYFTLSKVDFEGLNSGASIPSMTTDILYHLKIVVPDQNTLIAFDKQIETLFSEKQLLQKNNDNLTKQRDLLLPRLMSGKLAV